MENMKQTRRKHRTYKKANLHQQIEWNDYRNRVLFFDLETTGLSPKLDRVIEIGVCNYHGDKKNSWYIHPEIEIPEESTRIHKITDDMVKDAPPFKQVFYQLQDWVKRKMKIKLEDTIFIGHNCQRFDLPFLEHELERFNYEGTSPILKERGFLFVDNLTFSRVIDAGKKRHNLDAICRRYNIPIDEEKRHTADEDVKMLGASYRALEQKSGIMNMDVRGLIGVTKNNSDRDGVYIKNKRNVSI